MTPSGIPQKFVGTSRIPAPYTPPPFEMIEAIAASIEVNLGPLQIDGTPQYVIDGAKGLVVALNHWAEEIKNPRKIATAVSVVAIPVAHSDPASAPIASARLLAGKGVPNV